MELVWNLFDIRQVQYGCNVVVFLVFNCFGIPLSVLTFACFANFSPFREIKYMRNFLERVVRENKYTRSFSEINDSQNTGKKNGKRQENIEKM